MTPDATTQPDLAPDPTTVLDPLPVDDEAVKADAWDAFPIPRQARAISRA